MQIMLWPSAVLFLLGAPLLIFVVIAGAELSLNHDNFIITQSWRSLIVKWQDAGPFKAVAVRGSMTRLIVFDNAAAENTRMAALNLKLTGHNCGLSDTYGLDPDDLASLLNAWRARALQDRSPIE